MEGLESPYFVSPYYTRVEEQSTLATGVACLVLFAVSRFEGPNTKSSFHSKALAALEDSTPPKQSFCFGVVSLVQQAFAGIAIDITIVFIGVNQQ